jgi:hypothetical protein
MTGSSRVVLQSRDRHLLDELKILRLVDREQAMLFAPFNSTTRANARLLALTRAGYLKRTMVGTIAGGRRTIYFLPEKRVPKSAGDPLARQRIFEHQLAINRLYYRFKYVPPPQPGVRVLEWQSFDTVLSPQVPLIPDGYVKIKTPAGERALFIEVDLGTESLRVWERKTEQYLNLAVSGEYARLFRGERFGVLIVTTTERRLDHIRQTITARTEKLFWLTTFQVLEQGGVWAPIWLRPVREERQSLT